MTSKVRHAPAAESSRFAPIAILDGSDAGEVERILADAGFDCHAAEIEEIAAGMSSGTLALAVVAPETLTGDGTALLVQAIAAQSAWSDFPFLMLLDRTATSRAAELVEALGYVLLVERPVETRLLLNAVRTALRARERQREAEAHSKQSMRESRKARRRIKELRSAHQALLRELEDRSLAEQRLRQSEELYRLLARATTDAVWDLDLTTHTIDWTDSDSSFFGYGAEINPTSLEWWRERIHCDDVERVWSSFEQALKDEATHWSEHYRFLCANGEWASVYDRGYIIRDETGQAARVVGAMSDVTERQRAGAELQRMQAELVHVSRLSAMGAMASTLAHELNQPLTAVASYVRGGLRLLEGADGAAPPDVRDALEAAEASALKAGQIVRGLRELVSHRAANSKTQDLSRIVKEAGVLAFVDEQAQGVTRKVAIDPAARWVEADSVQIQQVLINLVRNSIQAMARKPRREIAITARPTPDDMVEVSVSDTGEGLSPEARAALFSSFRSRKSEGMGIGLSISRTIIEGHGGRIWADDDQDEGAVFRFTLPRARDIPARARAMPAQP